MDEKKLKIKVKLLMYKQIHNKEEEKIETLEDLYNKNTFFCLFQSDLHTNGQKNYRIEAYIQEEHVQK